MGWAEPHRGKWRGVYRDVTGKRVRGPAMLHKAMAQQWADEQTELVRAGIDRDPRRGRVPLRVFAEQWQAARVVEQSTAASDKARLALVLEEFGDVPLEHLDALAIQTWAKRLRRDGKAAATVRKYVNVLSSVLSAAVLAQRIQVNPCGFVKLDPAPPSREVFLTHEQLDALVEAMDCDADKLAVLLFAYTGPRWGEGVALHRNRVDFLRRRIEIVDTVVEVSGERWLKEYPKGGDRRWLPMPGHLADTLAVAFSGPVVKCGLELRDARGNVKPHRCAGLVLVSDTTGGVLSRHTWGRDRFKPAARKAGLPVEARVHDLRHTYASWCAEGGVPMRELQRRLGHKSITTTERYSHFYEVGEANMAGLERPAAKRLEAR